MSFVNNSLADLVSSLNGSLNGARPSGSSVYSKFNLKVLLFMAARGYISDLKIFSKGPGALIKFRIKTNEYGIPVFRRIAAPYLNRGFFSQKLIKFCSYRELSSLYSSEFVVVSTRHGLMTANEAVRLRVGGFVVLVVN